MSGRRIAGIGPYFVAYHDHLKPKFSRLIYRFKTAEEARTAATKLNAWANERSPVKRHGGKFSFYFVHTERNSGTLPWLAGAVKLLEVKHTEVECGS